MPIWALLCIQAEAADGITYDQLKRVLRLPDDWAKSHSTYNQVQKALFDNTTSTEIAVAQALVIDKNVSVEIPFLYKLENIYEAELLRVDFRDPLSASKPINQYVAGKTGNKISRIVKSEDLKNEHFISISATSFKGKWKVSSGTG